MDDKCPPMPTSPLRRELGVSTDGRPLSPITISRSTSAMSDEDINDMLMEKQLRTYKKALKEQLRRINDEIRNLELNKERFDNTFTKQYAQRKIDIYKNKTELITNKLVAIKHLLRLF